MDNCKISNLIQLNAMKGWCSMVKNERKELIILGQPLFILLFLIISMAMIAILNMENIAFSSKNLENITGGLTILDTRLFYTQTDIFNFLDRLGEQGRNAYQLTHIVPDLIFPIAYSLFFASLSIWLAKHLNYSRKQIQRVFLFSLVAGIFDLLENFTIIVLVAAFPRQHPVLGLSSQLFTLIKFGFFFIIILVLIILSIRLISKNISKANWPFWTQSTH